jgi:hypothetical protein
LKRILAVMAGARSSHTAGWCCVRSSFTLARSLVHCARARPAAATAVASMVTCEFTCSGSRVRARAERSLFPTHAGSSGRANGASLGRQDSKPTPRSWDRPRARRDGWSTPYQCIGSYAEIIVHDRTHAARSLSPQARRRYASASVSCKSRAPRTFAQRFSEEASPRACAMSTRWEPIPLVIFSIASVHSGIDLP